MTTTLRPAGPSDVPLLRAATLANLNWLGERFTAREVDAIPAFAHYFRGWPADGGFGFVAEVDGRDSGAVWVVQLTREDPGYGYVADDVPELSIWVAADQRGKALGTTLLDRIVEEGRLRGLRGISLSVEEGNPVRRLYERHGFAPVSGASGETLLRPL